MTGPGPAPDEEDPDRTLATPRPTTPSIPGLELSGRIGAGGLGAVYRARQEFLEREVAVKVLFGTSGDEEFVRRFQREATTLAGLSHPNIVACHQAGTTPAGECFLVMELIDGPDLSRHVRREGALAPTHALAVCTQLARALQHAQEAGIIHRDVKPANVLLKPLRAETCPADEFPFTAMLADLGLARATSQSVETQITQPGVVLGTPATMAPEQIQSPDEVDHRADVYGLGCVLYEALTGAAAFGRMRLDEILLAKLQGEPPDPSVAAPGLDRELAAFVRRLLARDPADRPRTHAEVARTCDALHARLTGAPRPRRRRALVAFGLVLVALAAALAVLVARRGDPPLPLAPVATFEATPAAGRAPLEVELVAPPASTERPVEEYRWDLGDGTQRAGHEPRLAHRFDAPPFGRASYTVRLVAVGPGGQAEAARTVEVEGARARLELFAADPDQRLDGWLTTDGAGAWTAPPDGPGMLGRAPEGATVRLARALPDGPWTLSGALFPHGGDGARAADLVALGLELADGAEAWVKLTTLLATKQLVQLSLPRGGEGPLATDPEQRAGVDAAAPLRFSFECRAGTLRAALAGGAPLEVALDASPVRVVLQVGSGRGGFAELALEDAGG